MQPFQFGLATLLRIRCKMEERAKNEFNDQQRRVLEQTKLLEQLMEDRKTAEVKAKAAGRETVDLALEKNCAEYIQTLRYRIEAAQLRLNQLSEALEQLRDNYIQAQQAVKILEKLKEHRYSDYLKEARRQEQNFLDEVAISHFKSA
ncbi:flagellar export protein FliJ [bacterium]|nr:flagellar export protein FliJ [bacterium]